MYADDTKILATIKSEADRARLQKDLDELMEWIKEWQLQLNDEKCKVMHTGIKNPNFNYQINGKNLSETHEEKDLGVIFQSGLKWGAQVEIAAAKANRVIGQIRRSFRCRDPNIVKLLYTSLVRPHIEYANSIWNPYFQKDIDRLERVQRRATKTGCLSHLSYQDRLKALKLTPLTERRLRGDLIEFFKLVKGIDSSNLTFSTIPGTKHSSRLSNSFFFKRELVKRSTPRHHFLTNRIATIWSSLPQYVVDSKSTNQFKNRLDNII